jgi:hypothetical protein
MASKGKIDTTTFQPNLQALGTQAGQQAAMNRNNGSPRPWNFPPNVADPLNIGGITAGFDRSAIDTNYAQLIQDGTDPGTVGDVICVKTQGDYIAEMERGFRARHATPVRCIGHAMARRSGHSKPNGIFWGHVLKHVQNALKSGQAQ